MNSGYVRIFRRLTESDLWLDEKFTRGQAWVDLVLIANHKDGSFRYRGIKVNIKRGQVGYSEVSLAKRWRWSRNKVRRFLCELKTEHQIEQQKSNVLTLITIVNYDTYQTDGTPNETPEKHQKDTNKKEKKEKNNICNTILEKFNSINDVKLKLTPAKKTQINIRLKNFTEGGNSKSYIEPKQRLVC